MTKLVLGQAGDFKQLFLRKNLGKTVVLMTKLVLGQAGDFKRCMDGSFFCGKTWEKRWY